MKMLLLLRHGKSPHDGSSDWERPLAPRARKQDLPHVAEFVRKLGLLPQWILSSDARRARETAETFAADLDPAPEVVLTRALYLVDAANIAGEIRSLPESVGTAVVVGHNAGLEDFAEWLGGRLPDSLKPGGLCVFRLDLETWLDLHPARATRTAFVNPKELRD
ncbi:MAG: histidine phosphatase family protein [Lentisphaeria bacterium]|nr:histidine phosphatase family protein [Lentisphaeria bacterium]